MARWGPILPPAKKVAGRYCVQSVHRRKGSPSDHCPPWCHWWVTSHMETPTDMFKLVHGWPPTKRPFCFMYDFLRKRSNKVISYRAMERSNSPRNCRSDVWYMTLTNDISVMRKYRMLPLVATGRYSSRALLILISVSAAICSFWLTSSAVVLVTLSTLIRSSSSTREP